jgi:dipeptidyl aminopeptidase/acylaminoacyl peptidase
MIVDDLFRVQRVSDPQISPDGSNVVYVLTTVDLPNNKTKSNLWLATGKEPPHQLTTTTTKDRHPRWSPDGKHILFESTRSGNTQLWIIDIAGGEARQLTTIATEANTAIWSPDGNHIAFVSAVWPEYSAKPFKESDDLNKKRQEEISRNPVKAKVFTKLFFRHWDEYVEDKRQHLFVMPYNNGKGGEPKDVTPGDRDAYPTSTTFSIGDDFTFSPDSTHLVFTAVPDRDEAWSTNHDVCRVPIVGGKVECLTKENPAADGAPQFSPNGKFMAYRAQKRPSFEADKWEIMVVETDPSGAFRGKPRGVTANFDNSPDGFVWADDNETIFFVADVKAKLSLGMANALQGKYLPFPGIENHSVSSLSASRQGTTLAFTLASLTQPPEVFIMKTTPQRSTSGDLSYNGAVVRCSDHNPQFQTELDLPNVESGTVEGAGGIPMQMWLLKPPGFDPKKKWPLAFLVHGGPQGSWENGWSYRWNPALWSSQGYVVALPNPRGSTGFGQKYVDEISGDWGGKCYEDLMAGLAFLEKQPYIDKERMAAAGASFGGYMMNWFEGHTTKFKTLITHCGVYNFDSMYALTEELWFDEWEHGGPPWVNRESYEKFSPHRFAKNFKTPMLIIHNDLDFRVPVAEGLQLFTTLQRLGIPSKMINFPDEGHWVLKPANSQYWHKEVFGWLAKYAPPGGK